MLEPRKGLDETATIARPSSTVVVPDEVIDHVVRELNDLQGRATLELALEMGRVIVERFYAGDLTAWRANRARETSFRRLAARADLDLKVSATCLYRAVSLYELSRRLNIGTMSGLTATHLRLVIGLVEKDQADLLVQAASHHWSTERLEREAAKRRRTLKTRKGRSAAPTLLKAVWKLVRSWKSIESMVKEEEEDLSAEELQSCYNAVDHIKERLEHLARRLATRTPGEARRSNSRSATS